MSNVLMGLIGVVLFAGLAMMAASNFGSSFIESSNNGRAVAILSATGQIAQAVTLVRMTDGTTLDASADLEAELVVPRYLKVLPVNPILTVVPPILVTDAGATTGPGTAAIMDMGGQSRPLCIAIARSSGLIGQNATNLPEAVTIPEHHNGCFKAGAGSSGAFTPGHYYAFTRV